MAKSIIFLKIIEYHLTNLFVFKAQLFNAAVIYKRYARLIPVHIRSVVKSSAQTPR